MLHRPIVKRKSDIWSYTQLLELKREQTFFFIVLYLNIPDTLRVLNFPIPEPRRFANIQARSMFVNPQCVSDILFLQSE